MSVQGTVETAQGPTLPAPEDAAVQEALKASGPIPAHVAIIMDGNGRWARERGQDRVFGHYEGVRSVRDVTEAAVQIGIEHLTLYTFSTENWGRPRSEVEGLMTLLVETVEKERETLLRNGVRLALLGDLDALPPAPRAGLVRLMNETAPLARMTLHLALSYSGRWEITQAARRLAEDVAAGRLTPEDVDEAAVAARMATGHMPEPDLLIRTGGECRISNFLLWSLAYTELYFTPCLWPDFRRPQLYEAVRDFQRRERRFGRVSSS
ncbi:MAG TPA: polyprenyl diphosphate synthase [Rhodothermales bacterium]|nr:polyprenyl diphosphate synthase [Rhodothermales bacterium]